ncbi:MAG: hypothetical protein R3B06_11720 [Kofleriaceae bacterium]
MRAILVGALVATLAGGCVVRYLRGPQLTGTCAGACDHYVTCRGGDPGGVGDACRAECPQVFGDRDSLMAFESLSCAKTVEYVEGPSGRPPGAPPTPAVAAP